ncbi:MAG: hypothetical protein LH469_01410 [Frankiaceae bacterium]|nr:hypothetical protein [Frankiaceae bacterium]
MSAYLDTSAPAELIVAETETAALREWLSDRRDLSPARWTQPVDGQPSTHILKPDPKDLARPGPVWSRPRL